MSSFTVARVWMNSGAVVETSVLSTSSYLEETISGLVLASYILPGHDIMFITTKGVARQLQI